MFDREKHKKFMDLQIQEMLIHKWIESEKAGYDLGEKALIDWKNKYAEVFRLLNWL